MHQSCARLLARPIPSFREGAKGTLGPMRNAPNHDEVFYPLFSALALYLLARHPAFGRVPRWPHLAPYLNFHI